jgi:acetylornithine/succinyldiaminopimelate/putrescine aminotransferase
MKSNLDLVNRKSIWIQTMMLYVVVMGKGMGGGMPVGAFTSGEMMDLLVIIKLGHITTLADTVIAAACLALLKLKPISCRKL